jgi:hypothetical protein
MRRLWRAGIWGATTASALLIAVFATRSEIGLQKVADVLAAVSGGSTAAIQPVTVKTQVVTRASDSEAETRRLSDAVRTLASDNGRLEARIAAVEHNMDDITGSVTRQIEAVKAETVNPWPADMTPTPATPAAIASMVTPVLPPPDGITRPLPQNSASPPSIHVSERAPESIPAPELAASPPREYGVDIGNGLSVAALRARWAGIHSAHPQLFAGLLPIVTLREVPHTNRVELRLVVVPLANAKAAAQLCTSLASIHVTCQPTIFDGQHIALQ